jgi:site-specific recombinase XerC
VQTGLRISELTGLTRADVHLGPGAHVACHGKGSFSTVNVCSSNAAWPGSCADERSSRVTSSSTSWRADSMCNGNVACIRRRRVQLPPPLSGSR